MRVLLDENLDHRLRHHLGAHEVFTVSYMGWSGLKNGKLLQAAQDARLDIFVTGDRTLSEEQKSSLRSIAVVTLSAIEWRIMRDHLPRILAAVDSAQPGRLYQVDCGTFNRRNEPEA